ncbi:MAG: 4Fe-4S double cluster binding domain-containing protein [Oscillospiraceae bacterium]
MQKLIRDFLKKNGAKQVGFCKLDGNNPFSLTYAISFTVPLSNAIIDTIDTSPSHTYFHHYRSVNALIDNISLRAGMLLQEKGYKYVPIPASQSVNGMQGIFSHKYAGFMSGLVYIGKSGLFISEENGPRVRLGTILTNCKFITHDIIPKCNCGDCNLCKISCPAMAITGEKWSPNEPRENIIDAKACSDFMKKNFQHIGRGAVCGICMQVCPKGNKA